MLTEIGHGQQNMQSGYKYMLSGNSINSILKLGASELGGTSIQDEYLDEATLQFFKRNNATIRHSRKYN